MYTKCCCGISNLLIIKKMDKYIFAIVRDCPNPDGSLVEISENRKNSIKKASERRKDELHTKIEDDQKYVYHLLCVKSYNSDHIENYLKSPQLFPRKLDDHCLPSTSKYTVCSAGKFAI